MELGKFLSIPSFAAIIAPVLSLLIICQLAPTTPTIYEKIISSNYKEAFIIAGLNGTFLGWIIMASNTGETLSMADLFSFQAGFSASLVTISYSLFLAFLYIGYYDQESNIEPNENCFEKVIIKKSINYRFLIGQFIFWSLIFWTVLDIKGHSSLKIFIINVPAVILILLIFSLTALRTSNLGYIKTFKILFYDQYGDYDIRKISLSIRTAKKLIIGISILLLFMVFVDTINMNLTDTFYIIGSISLSLVYLLYLYQLLILQDVLILQNAILNDRFHEYRYQDQSTSIYVLIAIFIGILSFIGLLNFIKI
ncbi:uncharacterized protein METZ01_LOCUS139544 [marine metagenome]|uniref:Uncharacterized protein n=1 Tax=marine metagenome TaxID=408172 RepID=A0A381ZBV2_9ZZZZ